MATAGDFGLEWEVYVYGFNLLRTVAKMRRLYLCAGGLDILKFDKTSTDL